MTRCACLLACTALFACCGPAPREDSHLFDAGVEQYRRRAWAGAWQSFGQSAKAPGDPEMALRAAFNQANSALQQGIALAGSDPRQAISWLERAAASYREVLRRKPLADAAWNLEVARLHMARLQRKDDPPPASAPPPPPPSPKDILAAEPPLKPTNPAPAPVEKDW